MVRSIRRLLVANRGEIASRIFRTCAELGISTAAVFAEPDGQLPFVRQADVAVPLTGSTAAETYLDVAQLLAAARVAGADAIHPGYGFLAENAAFAQAVLDAGLLWVGPRPESIRAMGSKVEAKRLAVAAGVPVAPSVELVGDDAGTWLEAAQTVGFPLLVKASAGGGGRGMRLVGAPRTARRRRQGRAGGRRSRRSATPRSSSSGTSPGLGTWRCRCSATARPCGAPAGARVLDPAQAPEDRRGDAVAGADRLRA